MSGSSGVHWNGGPLLPPPDGHLTTWEQICLLRLRWGAERTAAMMDAREAQMRELIAQAEADGQPRMRLGYSNMLEMMVETRRVLEALTEQQIAQVVLAECDRLDREAMARAKNRSLQWSNQPLGGVGSYRVSGASMRSIQSVAPPAPAAAAKPTAESDWGQWQQHAAQYKRDQAEQRKRDSHGSTRRTRRGAD